MVIKDLSTINQVLRDAGVTYYHEIKRLVRKYAEPIQGNRSRMYPIMNDEELDKAMNKMPIDIEELTTVILAQHHHTASIEYESKLALQ